MYNNIGGKIRGIARALFVILMVVSVISGLFVMFSNPRNELMPLFGILVIVIGGFLALLLSWLTYGFGELIDKATAIERNTRGGKKIAAPKSEIPEI